MNEFRFQHEEDPQLKTQAAEALKKTQWLEYIDYVKSIMVLKGIWAVLYLYQIVIMLFEIYRPAEKLSPGQLMNYTVNDIFPILLMIVFGVTLLRFLFKWQRKHKTMINHQYQIKKARYRYGLSLLIAVAPLFYFGLGNVRQRSNLSVFVFLISLLIWDFIDLRKLKRKLRSWGVIESIDGSSPIAFQIPSPIPTVDEIPKRQSFEREPTAKTPSA